MAYTTITDPSVYFQTQLFTGTGSSLSVTNTGNADLQPDLVWIKNRDIAASHVLTDTTRGATKSLFSDQTSGESTETQQLTSFNSDGFTVGTSNNVNGNGNGSVAWQWKANGGTTATDTNGAVNSTVQANTTAGFSIVTWTSAGSTNVGHGLGVAPNLIIMKARNGAENWLVSSDEIGWTKRIRLNLTSGSATSSAFGQAPTSSIFYCNPASASYNYVAYCFAEKQGFSKFGSYTGNGSTDGSFIYTGFKPAWVMIKSTSLTQGWGIWDNKRTPLNLSNKILIASSNTSELTGFGIDILSNGFKLRSTDANSNQSGEIYIYMAFAQNPLVATNDVIALAR